MGFENNLASGFGYGSIFDDKASNDGEDSDEFVSCTQQPEPSKVGSKRKADKDNEPSSSGKEKKKKKSEGSTAPPSDSALRQKGQNALEKMMTLQKGIADQLKVISSVNDELAKRGLSAVSPFLLHEKQPKKGGGGGKKTSAAAATGAPTAGKKTSEKKPSTSKKAPAAAAPPAEKKKPPASKKAKSAQPKPCELEKELEETIPNEESSSSSEEEESEEGSSREEEEEE